MKERKSEKTGDLMSFQGISKLTSGRSVYSSLFIQSIKVFNNKVSQAIKGSAKLQAFRIVKMDEGTIPVKADTAIHVYLSKPASLFIDYPGALNRAKGR